MVRSLGMLELRLDLSRADEAGGGDIADDGGLPG